VYARPNPAINNLVVQLIAGKIFVSPTLDRDKFAGYILFVGIQPGEAMRSHQEIP